MTAHCSQTDHRIIKVNSSYSFLQVYSPQICKDYKIVHVHNSYDHTFLRVASSELEVHGGTWQDKCIQHHHHHHRHR